MLPLGEEWFQLTRQWLWVRGSQIDEGGVLKVDRPGTLGDCVAGFLESSKVAVKLAVWAASPAPKRPFVGLNATSACGISLFRRHVQQVERATPFSSVTLALSFIRPRTLNASSCSCFRSSGLDLMSSCNASSNMSSGRKWSSNACHDLLSVKFFGSLAVLWE